MSNDDAVRVLREIVSKPGWAYYKISCYLPSICSYWHCANLGEINILISISNRSADLNSELLSVNDENVRLVSMYQPKPTQTRSCLVSVVLFVYTMSVLISQELIIRQISPIVLMIYAKSEMSWYWFILKILRQASQKHSQNVLANCWIGMFVSQSSL